MQNQLLFDTQMKTALWLFGAMQGGYRSNRWGCSYVSKILNFEVGNFRWPLLSIKRWLRKATKDAGQEGLLLWSVSRYFTWYVVRVWFHLIISSGFLEAYLGPKITSTKGRERKNRKSEETREKMQWLLVTLEIVIEQKLFKY